MRISHRMSTGIFSIRLVVKVVSTRAIQGKNIKRQTNTARIFGTNVRVNSCICVTAWNRPMESPTTRLTKRVGPDAKIMVLNTSAESYFITSMVI